MSRYIDADALKDKVIHESNRLGSYGYMDTKSIVDLIDDAPTVEPQQWIPIEDRPPEFGKGVLISHRGFVSIDWLTQSEGDVYFFASRVAIADIDAWMPLPAPWKGEDDEQIH